MMEVIYPSAYADLVRFKVRWETSYGKGGNSAIVDFNLSGFTEPPLTQDKPAQ